MKILVDFNHYITSDTSAAQKHPIFYSLLQRGVYQVYTCSKAKPNMKLGGCTNLFTLLLDIRIQNREVWLVLEPQT